MSTKRRVRVLAIDDEPSMIEWLQILLEGEGYEVRTALVGARGEELFRAWRPDVVLLDMILPDVDGLDLLRRFRAASEGTEVIVVTGHGSVPRAVDAMKAGAHAFVEKPIDPSALTAVLEKAVERRDLRHENEQLRKQLHGTFKLASIIGRSKRMHDLLALVESVAASDANILIQDADLAALFEQCAERYTDVKKICNWINGPLMKDAALACAKDPGGGGSLSANATQLTAEARLYQASFATGDWSGRLRAVRVDSVGALGPVAWEAAIPPAEKRRILTSSATHSGIDFTWPALGAAGMQALVGNADTLNYLRGDQSGEGPAGFRVRSARLGAVVHSQIALAGGEDFGYEGLVDTAALAAPASVAGLAYPAYLRATSGRTKLVLVGANDGMLHGFDAASGAEKFAYVPRALLAEPISAADPRSVLVRLADPAFAPRFYVDGSPSVGDAYWGGAWRTVVV